MKYILFFLSCLLSIHSNVHASAIAVQVIKGGKLKEQQKNITDCKRCILIAEQKDSRVAVVDLDLKRIIWDWKPENDIKLEDVKWFSNMSDAKAVYNGKYILATASGGGVALIRIADKKTVFYAYAGGNTHSAEILPDGNIVSASSTGNYLTLIKVDTLNFPGQVYTRNIPLPFAHNVVWDRKNKLLWSAGMNKLYAYSYNSDCNKPELELRETYDLPGNEAHDLFPVYGSNALWLTTTSNVYRFDIRSKKADLASDVLIQAHIKSVSSGKKDHPVIVVKPKVSWWTDEIIDSKGNTLFMEKGLKIYKARWFLFNTFSYAPGDEFKICR